MINNHSKKHKLSGLHQVMASLLSIVLICSQVLGQSLSAQTLEQGLNQTRSQRTVDPSDTSVPTIRLAQTDTGTTWSGEIDIDPPIIDHEALETGVPGEPQQFSALVVDDRGLTHVMLFHRERTGAQYSSVEMVQVGDTSEYTATIDTSVDQNSIEYYIEALDTGGNRVLKGFPFFPLVRQLDPVPESTTQVTEDSGTNRKLIYVLVGVAAVGLAAALLSGGSDSDDPDPEPPGTDPTVPINITVTPP